MGFDFPIGLPRAYARVRARRDVLPRFGRDAWSEFFAVADTPDEISIHRPFYPRTAQVKGVKKQSHLTAALDLSMDDLRRRCEYKQPERSAACALFWTIGGNQVGKGALAGWRMLQAQPARSVSYWPFDGPLEHLIESSETVVVETYPAEFYGHLGLPRVVGKRKHAGRLAQSAKLLGAADRLEMQLAPDLRHQIDEGFGTTAHGEDAFDVFVGLLGMINVLAGHRSSGEPRDDEDVVDIEGWILGQRVA